MENGNGEQKILTPKRRLEPILPVAEFKDVIDQLVGDAHCKTCAGRYWTSFTKHPDGSIKLDLCHCASFAETQVVTVLRAVAVMANDQDQTNKAIIEILTRTENTQKAIIEMLTPKPGLFTQAMDYVKRFKSRIDAHDELKEEVNATEENASPERESQS